MNQALAEIFAILTFTIDPKGILSTDATISQSFPPHKNNWYYSNNYSDLRFLLFLKLSFEITGEQMQVWTTKWVIPPGEMKVTVGGQQPDQKTKAPSNILEGSFTIKS